MAHLMRLPSIYRLFSKKILAPHTSKNLEILLRYPLSCGKCYNVKYLQSLSSNPENNRTTSILKMNPNDFAEYLKAHNIRRCFAIYDKKKEKVFVSHPELEEMETFFVTNAIDYNKHEAVFMGLGLRTGCLLSSFIWRTNRGQAYGGIRLFDYPTLEHYLKDGLRLSKSMGIKAALAGVWAGGGAGVLSKPGDNMHMQPDFRQNLFFDYGDFITSLNGCFVAVEDMGSNVIDMNNIHTRSRYVACISEDIGGSGNPCLATAKGVIKAMEGALDFLNLGTFEGKTIALQGAGNIGAIIISELLDQDIAHLYVTDCHQKRVDDIKDVFAAKSRGRLKVQKVPIEDCKIAGYRCDIFSPCSIGNILNEDTIPMIQAKIVCGAASNQLGCQEDNQLLKDRGITYVADILANRMGVVNCANEPFGRLSDDVAISEHFSKDCENAIYVQTKQILKKAADENITPVVAAYAIADELSLHNHPLWPNRSQQIIEALVKENWYMCNDFWRRRSNFVGVCLES